MRDFQAELKAIFDKSLESYATQPKPKPVIGAELAKAVKAVIAPTPPMFYNIHKRSLPPGTDQAVAWNFTKVQAVWFIANHLKSTETIDLETGRMKATYYDPVRQDGEYSGIYENEKPVTKGGKYV